MPGSSAIRAGRAFVELFTKDDDLRRGLKAARTRIDNFAKGVNALSNHLLTLGAAAAVPLAFAVKSASNLEEVMSKFSVVFGEQSDAVKQWADDFAAAIGRSKRQIAEFLAGTQDLFVPLGFDPRAAEEMSKAVTQLAIDLGSFNNKADDVVLRDLHAALTGSGETMKKYGVIVSEAAVKQELFNQGIDAAKASDQQKVLARWNIILRGTTAAQGDAARTADSFANKTKSLQGAIEDTAAEIGTALLPVIAPLLEDLVDAVRHAADWARANEDLVVKLAKVTAGLVGLGIALKVIGPLLTTISMGIKGIQLALAAGPLGVILTVIAGVVFYFWQLLEASREWDALLDKWESKKPFEQMREDAAEIAAAFDRVSATIDSFGETPEERAARGGLPRDAAGRLRESGRTQSEINREMERTFGDRGDFTPEERAAARADQEQLNRQRREEAERRREEQNRALVDAVEDMLQREAMAADELARRQEETQRLLERMPETLVEGSEAAAKAFLDVNRNSNPEVAAAEKQVEIMGRVEDILGQVLQVWRGNPRVQVDGFAL